MSKTGVVTRAVCIGFIAVVLSLPAARVSGQSSCPTEGVVLQVLGSGGPLAPGRASSSYLVWIDGQARVMVDVGGGSYLRFLESGAELRTLDAIALSHHHPDHVSDLPALLWPRVTRQTALLIAGPSGTGSFPALNELLARLFGTDGAFPRLGERWEETNFLLDAMTVDVSRSETVTIMEAPDLTITAHPVPHYNNVPALSYRIDSGGVSLVFGGDQNGSDPGFTMFARQADAMVMHMTLSPAATPENASGFLEGHAGPRTVGEVAGAADVSHLILSHLNAAGGGSPEIMSLSDLDGSIAEVRRGYDGLVSVSRDLDCFLVR